MSDPYIGQITLFAGNFAPAGWALCDGTLLPISNFSALFSILGTTYGGDGQTNFGLPDLRSRVPIHVGNSVPSGLPAVDLGEKGGSSTAQLGVANLPAHSHGLRGLEEGANSFDAEGNSLAQGLVYNSGSPDVTLNSGSIESTGSGTPFNNMQPYLGINFIIALTGLFPSP